MFSHVDRAPDRCDCYKCVGSEYEWTEEYGRVLMNDLEWHTLLAPCPDCGRPRTEYRDLGTKGRFVCWWCRKRAAGPGEPS